MRYTSVNTLNEGDDDDDDDDEANLIVGVTSIVGPPAMMVLQ